jgi:hypothetical protein
MNLNKKSIILQANNQYEFYMLNSFCKELSTKYIIDLLVPYDLKFEKYIFSFKYNKIFYFDKKLRNLLSLKSIINTIKLCVWAKENRLKYEKIIFGAYRHEVTSIISKYFKGNVKLIAIKQGLILNGKYNYRILDKGFFHNSIYYLLFGYSNLVYYGIISKDIPISKSKFMYSKLKWSQDPIEKLITIGEENKILKTKDFFCLPNFKLNKNRLKKNILIIGERTKNTTPSLNDPEKVKNLYSLLLKKFPNHKFYLRPRKTLTDLNFFKAFDFQKLDPDEHFPNQLDRIKPELVLSIKSSACKISAYMGYNSCVLYPLLNLNIIEFKILDYFFGDSNINIIKDLNEINLETSHIMPKTTDSILSKL